MLASEVRRDRANAFVLDRPAFRTEMKLLIVANVAAMFRDFLNPFGPFFRSKGWRVDAMAADLTGSDYCDGVFDNVWDVKWSRNPFGIENFTRAPRAFLKKATEVG